MSKSLQFARALFGDDSIVALSEWAGPHGDMGVYHSKGTRYIYLLVFIQAQNLHYTHQYPDVAMTLALRDAEIIAAFAGAQEIVA